MLGHTWVLEPLAEAADSNASSLPDGPVRVLEASLNERPDLVHERSHELAAALNRNTEGEHGSATMSGFAGSEVLQDEVAQRGEDLVWGKVGRKAIDDAESRLCERSVSSEGFKK